MATIKPVEYLPEDDVWKIRYPLAPREAACGAVSASVYDRTTVRGAVYTARHPLAGVLLIKGSLLMRTKQILLNTYSFNTIFIRYVFGLEALLRSPPILAEFSL